MIIIIATTIIAMIMKKLPIKKTELFIIKNNRLLQIQFTWMKLLEKFLIFFLINIPRIKTDIVWVNSLGSYNQIKLH